ncbi:hypothetical protein HY632_02440 [Candidatus Uhrbacteria bacterium]|nr:hypothetical protein [Candidatus Uhrbacteria bacterium]
MHRITASRLLSAIALLVIAVSAPMEAFARTPSAKCVTDHSVQPARCITLAACEARKGTAQPIPCPPFECSADPTNCPSSNTTCTIDTDCPRSERCIGTTCRFAPSAPTSTNEPPPIKFTPVEPKIHFAPPGFSFSKAKVQTPDGRETYVSLPWLAEYVGAFYRWLIPVGAVLATVVIMAAGLIWATSGGGGQIKTAQNYIQNAILGLLLLVGSYTLLQVISPELVRLPALRVQVAQPITIDGDAEEPESVVGTEPGTVIAITGDNIRARGQRIDSGMLEPIQKAAAELASQNIILSITSGYRTIEDQKRQIADNCQNPPGAKTCNPKPGKAPACILSNGPASCPHTTGRAVDAWGWKDGKQCRLKKECITGKGVIQNPSTDPCRNDPCQAAVIKAMQNAGFCNWLGEAWHFEYPKPGMSTPCV